MRITASERARVTLRAEAEILRYADDHALWHKHLHGVELDPMQVLKCLRMDAQPNTIDVSCRRTGKTAVKELHALKYAATHPSQEVGIVAPRLQQSVNNLNYHLDAIRRSEALRAFVAWKSGREQLSDTRYQFANGSKGLAYGIMSQIDGDAISIASIEEVDDMPADRLLSRFLPMLGSARRLGVSRAVSFTPQIRITGVFKGADTLQGLIDSGTYQLLPAVNVHLGVQLGILNAAFMDEMRAQLPAGEYIRQFLCRNVSAQNHIWEKHVRKALAVGLAANLAPAGPLPGERYRKRGLIAFGYDHLGHGEGANPSKSALVVTEMLGSYCTFPYVRTWGAATDDKVVERDLIELWRYFRPDVAIGDAYGVGMLTDLNDRLYAEGLTDIDRRSIGDGRSVGSTWQEWPFAPLRFEGMVKHSMASALRSVFHNGQAAIPYFEDRPAMPAGSNVKQMPGRLDELTAANPDWVAFVRQICNIKAVSTQASYSSYKMADKKLGDDLFDAACAAVWALITRGIDLAPTRIETRSVTREQLLLGAA